MCSPNGPCPKARLNKPTTNTWDKYIVLSPSTVSMTQTMSTTQTASTTTIASTTQTGTTTTTVQQPLVTSFSTTSTSQPAQETTTSSTTAEHAHTFIITATSPHYSTSPTTNTPCNDIEDDHFKCELWRSFGHCEQSASGFSISMIRCRMTCEICSN